MADRILNDVIARILIDTTPLSELQLAEHRKAAAEDADLVNTLVEKKVISPNQGEKLREKAKEVLEAPTIPGWTIIRKLGQGGMGAVYKAVNSVLSKQVVAMKVLAPHLTQDKSFVERFKREAASAGALDHPNIVSAKAYGESASGEPYFAMEFVDGYSVRDLMDRQPKLAVGDALKIVYDVGLALQHASENKIVHRDIKPDNIMITRKEGIVKLADLGLAKEIGDENSMTQTGSGFGTPYYMPPEQARNAKYVDQRSDIYALGATLYHMLTSKLPFNGETALEVLMAKEAGTFPKASASNPDVPSQVNLIIDKMMAKDPAHRFQSADELIAQLDKLGLHHEQLSFIKLQPDAKAQRPSSKTSVPTNTPQKQATRPPSHGSTQPIEEPAGKASAAPADEYYLNYKDVNGKPVKTKMPKSRVIHMIKNNQLDEKVEISTSPKGPFRRLAAFPEFEPFLRARIAAKQFEKKGVTTQNKMSDLVANIDREQSRYATKKKVKEAGFLLWGLIVAALIFGGGGWGIYTFIIKPGIEKTSAGSKEMQDEIKRNRDAAS